MFLYRPKKKNTKNTTENYLAKRQTNNFTSQKEKLLQIPRCVSVHQVTSHLGAVKILRKPFVLATNRLTHIYSQLV